MNANNRLIPSTPLSVLVALLGALFFLTTPALGANSSDGIWSDIALNRIPARGARVTVPDRYRSLQINLSALEATLRSAPPEGVGSGVSLTLPMPDGSFQEFLVENSPIMAPALAKRFPAISTYLAVAKDNAAITARLDLTPAGFHAIVFSTEGTVYIDPYQMGSNLEYISYDKRAYSKNREPFYCAVTGEKVDGTHSPLQHVRTPVGDTLRTYRLAVAATGEYTAFHGGTVGGGLAAIVTTINRVTGIYERDLSVRLTLIANNNLIVYTNAAADPYTNSDAGALLGQNQANLDAVIGSANYDVGHVVGTGGGGLAGLGVVCDNTRKAQGETGSGSPIGDSFDVDFVAHEIGHQFDGNHTFNGTTGSCGGGNRNAATAYEPGSGTTIQAYAGICGAENIQPNSDDNFHAVSFDEMTSYVAGAGNCFVATATGNTAPMVNAGASSTVPVSTPLLLSEGAVSDPNGGQVLTYSWEQFDLGTASPPNTDNGNRPIFRSFKPQLTPVRFLPQMSDILANTTTLGESLPTTNRTLTFRLTVRDNAAGGGGVDFDTVAHTVTTTSGPFEVTSQNAPVSWPQNTNQTITWNVAGTTAAPVSCASVQIIYSDAGFPGFTGITLVLSTPNDGSETINTAPLPLSNTGRVMVKCDSNIFFDINNANITVTPGGAGMCGNNILDGGEQCDDGNMTGGDGCSATCQTETGFSCTAPVPEVPGTNALPEGGFEGGTPNPVWAETSTNFGTPLCTTASCGATFAPNSGTWGVWFGGIAAAESGSVQQSFVIETTDTELTFARRLHSCDSQPDVVRLNIDGTEVWFADGASPNCGEANYSTETIDLATATGGPYNDGAAHLIRFESAIFANNGGASNFFIDDASILRGGTPAQPSVCTPDGGPPNDDFQNAIVIGEGVVQHTLEGATPDGNSNAGGGNPDVWYAYTATANGTLHINTCGTQLSFGLDTLISAHTNTGVAGTTANEIDSNDDYNDGSDPTVCDTEPAPHNLDSGMAFAVTLGDPILIRVSEFDPPEAPFHLILSLDPAVGDADLDGILDDVDNCVTLANFDQLDTNGDGFGNRCDADLNNDCIVNPVDLGLFKLQFFQMGPNDADFTGDNIVNAQDLGLLKTLFFAPPGPNSTGTCP